MDPTGINVQKLPEKKTFLLEMMIFNFCETAREKSYGFHGAATQDKRRRE